MNIVKSQFEYGRTSQLSKIYFHMAIKLWSAFDLLYEKIGHPSEWCGIFLNLSMYQVENVSV